MCNLEPCSSSSWSCTQTDEFIMLEIKVPQGNICEALFEIANDEFVFTCDPHLFHFVFEGGVLAEGKGECAFYQAEKKCVLIFLPKADPLKKYCVAEKKEHTWHTKKDCRVEVKCDETGKNVTKDSILGSHPFALPNVDIRTPPCSLHQNRNSFRMKNQTASIDAQDMLVCGFDNGYRASKKIFQHSKNQLASRATPEEIDACCRSEENRTFSWEHFWSDQVGGCDEDGTAELLKRIETYIPWYLRGLPRFASETKDPSEGFEVYHMPECDDMGHIGLYSQHASESHQFSLPKVMVDKKVPQKLFSLLRDVLNAEAFILIWNGNVDVLDSIESSSKTSLLPETQGESQPNGIRVAEPVEESDFYLTELTFPKEKLKPSMYNDKAALQSLPRSQLVWVPMESHILKYTGNKRAELQDMHHFETEDAFNISRRRCLLVDILLASSYQDLVDCGEASTEAMWTLRSLSLALSYNRQFDTIPSLLFFFSRRCLSIPCVRSFEILTRATHCTCMILVQGSLVIARQLMRTFYIIDHDLRYYPLAYVYILPLLEWVRTKSDYPERWNMSQVENHKSSIQTGERGEDEFMTLAQKVHDAFAEISFHDFKFPDSELSKQTIDLTQRL